MSSPMQSTNVSPSIENPYAGVQQALNNADPTVRAYRSCNDLQMIPPIGRIDEFRLYESYLQCWFLPFDPAPWKTQLDSLSALITCIRIALLAQLLVMKQNTGFMSLTQVIAIHGFFENRVNKRNAP